MCHPPWKAPPPTEMCHPLPAMVAAKCIGLWGQISFPPPLNNIWRPNTCQSHEDSPQREDSGFYWAFSVLLECCRTNFCSCRNGLWKREEHKAYIHVFLQQKIETLFESSTKKNGQTPEKSERLCFSAVRTFLLQRLLTYELRYRAASTLKNACSTRVSDNVPSLVGCNRQRCRQHLANRWSEIVQDLTPLSLETDIGNYRPKTAVY